MDRPYASYPIDGIYNGEQPSNGPEEGESPEPSEGVPYGDIAKTVWESMQELPWDGSISFVALGEAQTRQYMGRRVSLLGGNPAWQNINTMIQTVSRDLQTNVISLSYGAPEQLGIEEWVELKRVNATSRTSSTLENMQGAPESPEYGFDPKPDPHHQPAHHQIHGRIHARARNTASRCACRKIRRGPSPGRK